MAAGRLPGAKRAPVKGADNPNSILTWDKVSQIREMYATGDFSQEKRGSLLGVKQVTVSAIVSHMMWRLNTPAG